MSKGLLSFALVLACACTPEIVFGPAESGAGGGGSGGTEEGTASAGGASVADGVASAVTSGAGGDGGAGEHSVAVTTTGAGGAQQGATTVSTGVGGGGVGCKSCGDALYGAPGPLCPASEPLFDALVVCACQVACAQECAGSCSGGPTPPVCDACIDTACWAELDACLEDV